MRPFLQTRRHGERRLRRGVRVNLEQSSDSRRCPATRDAAFRSDAKFRSVLGGCGDAFPRAFDAVAMDQAEKKLCAGSKRQVPKRLKVVIVGPIHRNGHMEVRNRTAHPDDQGTGDIDHFAGVFRIDEKLRYPIAIAQMKPEFHIARNRC